MEILCARIVQRTSDCMRPIARSNRQFNLTRTSIGCIWIVRLLRTHGAIQMAAMCFDHVAQAEIDSAWSWFHLIHTHTQNYLFIYLYTSTIWHPHMQRPLHICVLCGILLHSSKRRTKIKGSDCPVTMRAISNIEYWMHVTKTLNTSNR